MLYHPQQEAPSRRGGQAGLAGPAAERRPCVSQTGRQGRSVHRGRPAGNRLGTGGGGENYLYIYCLWVTGEFKGKGYGKALVDFIIQTHAGQYAALQVGTGDSPSTIPFYEACGFRRHHLVKNFFTDHYDHPIYEGGVKLVDMVYLQREL